MKNGSKTIWVLVALGALGCGSTAASSEEGDVDEQVEALATKGGYAGKFNRPGQGHANVCVKLKNGSAELRYPDFSPTGYTLDNALLDASGKGPCKDGYAQLDAREILQTPQGRLLFHRGGYGYENAGDVKYGHLWIADLASHVDVEPSPSGNGAPCGASNDPATEGHYEIKVRSIPSQMHYCKTTGACDGEDTTISYRSYGDPAQQGGSPDPSIHYTYLVWSWINVPGGGVVRTLLHDGDVFHRCDVPSIRLASVTADGKKNGWVRAIYGKTRRAETWTYGWIVHSHQIGGLPIVYHVERRDDLY